MIYELNSPLGDVVKLLCREACGVDVIAKQRIYKIIVTTGTSYSGGFR